MPLALSLIALFVIGILSGYQYAKGLRFFPTIGVIVGIILITLYTLIYWPGH